ncbi:hypothetical protein AYI69_g10735 [Smittium culicis]|uniref:Uncharacterized protein n=1 Tax=Smittium culicis TaxID=133412 RepID=A0A1R1X3V5_9FUNG|nr:hypothetical protein AYI69_g10735 [Smittium culicis]
MNDCMINCDAGDYFHFPNNSTGCFMDLQHCVVPYTISKGAVNLDGYTLENSCHWYTFYEKTKGLSCIITNSTKFKSELSIAPEKSCAMRHFYFSKK